MKKLILLALALVLGSTYTNIHAMEQIKTDSESPDSSPRLLRALAELYDQERTHEQEVPVVINNNNNNDNNIINDNNVRLDAREREFPGMHEVPAEERPLLSVRAPMDLDDELPGGAGWHMNNLTNAPLFLTWYKTNLRPFSGSNKLQMSEPLMLEPGRSCFVEFPPAGDRGYLSNRRELIVASRREQLTAVLSEQAAKELSVYSRANLNAAHERYKRGMEPVNFVVPPGSSEYVIEHEAVRQGWRFQNRAKRDVYCAWVSLDTTDRRRKLLQGQHIGSIRPTENVVISLPARQESGWLSTGSQRQLLFSFDQEHLQDVLRGGDLKNDVLVRTKDDFGVFGTQCIVVKDDNAPLVLALKRAIRVNNTTNDILHCALFLEDADGENAYICPGSSIELYPQFGDGLKLPESPKLIELVAGLKPNQELCLLIARDEQADLLDKKILSREDRNGLFKKIFNKSNYYEWTVNGEFDIVYDVSNPLKINVNSHGGGAFQSFAKYIGDISTPKVPSVREFEGKISAGHPVFVLSETTRRAYSEQSYQIIHAQSHNAENFPLQLDFLKARENIVREAINEFLQDDEYKLAEDEEIPKVALVFSGGGDRAKVGTIGFLRGADDTVRGGNVLGCCMYAAGLSGSTWALGSWVASGLRPREFSAIQKDKVQDGLREMYAKLISNDSESYAERRFIQGRYNQSHDIIGIYGHTLGHAFLKGLDLNGKDAHHITLSDLRKNLRAHPEVFPLPIFVATDPGKETKSRIWLEFDPFYIGTNKHGGNWIDAELFGCTFENGKVVHAVPGYPLAHKFGIWGSAFALNGDDIKKVSTAGGVLFQVVSAMGSLAGKSYDTVLNLEKNDEGHGRIAAGVVPNYLYKLDRVDQDLADRESLDLIDAGITKDGDYRHNFASVPVLWRKADVLIMCDAIDKPNSDATVEHLSASDMEARRLGLPFPVVANEVRQQEINKNITSLIMDKDTPVVVYMRPKRNKGFDAHLRTRNDRYFMEHGFDPDVEVPFRGSPNFTRTMNFSYNPEQFDLLSGLTEEIMIQSKDTIRQALKEAIKRKRELSSKK